MSSTELPADKTHSEPDKNSSAKKARKQSWIAIASLLSTTLLLILINLGSLLNIAFPFGCLLLGLYLYQKDPLIYSGYAVWLWFITPFVRRLADYRGAGFTEPSPVLLAPVIVTFIAGLSIKKNIRYLNFSQGLPFIFCFAAIFYALLVGLIYRNPTSVLIAFIRWLAPVLFSFHLYVNWRKYPVQRQLFMTVIAWAVLVMGTYGIIQYVFAPPWDTMWMEASQMVSIGNPRPFEIRIWSTLNSPRPFATVMVACLVTILLVKEKIRLPATIVGYLSFLLSNSRAAWGSWMISILILSASLKSKHQIKLFLTIATVTVLLIPLLTIDPIAERVLSRFSSFSNLESDGSAQARSKTYSELTGLALKSFFGQGLGGKTYDSAILTMLFDFGWFGVLFYVGGLLLFIYLLSSVSWSAADPFMGAARAITIGIFAQMPIGSPFGGAQGMLLWSFIGLGMAGIKFYKNHSAKSLLKKQHGFS